MKELSSLAEESNPPDVVVVAVLVNNPIDPLTMDMVAVFAVGGYR